MKIGGADYTNVYNIVKQTTTQNVSFEIKQNDSTDPILDYYHDLCKQYPDITFRLYDKESMMRNGDIGYKNSLNQVGENFGAHGQCSIDIEINVIKRMMQDPSYAIGVKAWIEDSQKSYAQYEKETEACGMIYTSVSLEDDNGRIVQGICRSRLSYSTEEELLAMRAESNAESYAEVIKEQIAGKTDLLDNLMEMLDKSREKQRELAKQYYESDDTFLRKRAAAEYDKHIALQTTL